MAGGMALFLFTIQFVACEDAVHPLEVFTGVLYGAAAAVFVATANLMTGAKTRPCKLFLSALQ